MRGIGLKHICDQSGLLLSHVKVTVGYSGLSKLFVIPSA